MPRFLRRQSRTPHEFQGFWCRIRTSSLPIIRRQLPSSPHWVVIVAEENQRILGHAFLDPMRLEAIAHVFRLTIVVHPGFQNRGVGEALMRDLMNWAKQAPHLQKIELLVRATNERAILLYSRMGFIEEGLFRKRVRLVNGGFVDDLAIAWFPR
jgi:ribosomal protein S18 acetylase RimI-like enzyme